MTSQSAEPRPSRSSARGGEALISHWIDGKPWRGETTRTGEVYNPATGRRTALVDFAEPPVVDAAVRAAQQAFTRWRETSLARRTAVMFAFRELLATRADELGAIITAEHGKVLDDAAGEVTRGLENVEFACGAPALLKGGFSANATTAVDVHSVSQPLGVVAVISPFNFPAMVPLWFVPNAIVCGNSVVLKPSEKDPSASVWLAELFAEAGLPPGVLNVVHGDRVAVDALLEHPEVKAVSFVGSTPVARRVHEIGTAHGKRVQALGGAKNHMVVLPDADLDTAADAAVSAGFGSAGERCMAISVVVAVDPIGDDLVERIAARMAELRVGDGSAPESQMGPLVTAAHRDRVASLVERGSAEGATLVVDGRDPVIDGPTGGFWLGPTMFDHVTPSMSIYREEIFGPVLSVVRAASAAEAVEIVNASPYGNGTAIFTADGGAARRFADQVEVGMIGVNVPIPVPVSYYSFGGWKDSLFGDAHAYGPHGLRFFTRDKVVTTRWPDHTSAPSRPSGRADLGFPRNT